ncbi:sigma-54 dependent transcriptional regulator, partial [Acidiferrobacter sp.]|uniref:sigma-54-dependent transcriptional regulator n=1 Tax=Acidiferrobacter sp. TaxID=1872107 RepID=UPI002610CCEA
EGAGGIELLTAIKSEYPSLPVIIMTAYATVEKAVEAIKLGAADFIVKPFAPAEIEQVLSRNIHIQGLETENRNLRVALGKEDLITRSEVLRRTLVMAERFAHSEATVLILGESGTGKSMIARRIHVASARSKGPFVEVNCASLSPTLLESELFGHCKGAFTGAVKDKVGRLESADGGTLFLDEVSELSAEGQAKLLRFLQDKVFERVGEIKTRAVDTRIIAATNRDLCHLIGGEGFREDLYYRLNVAEVLMPPLRSRSEDIPLLAERFLAQAAARNGLSSIPAMEDEVKSRIARYNWPGNVRELQNVIERCVILAGAGRITMEHLPDRLLTDTAP